MGMYVKWWSDWQGPSRYLPVGQSAPTLTYLTRFSLYYLLPGVRVNYSISYLLSAGELLPLSVTPVIRPELA